jgi:putative transcriptional regulator
MVRIKLNELLEQHKMNQVTLSELTGIRQATISNMFHAGTKRIQIEQINAICRVFGCTVDDLLEYVPDEQAG